MLTGDARTLALPLRRPGDPPAGNHEVYEYSGAEVLTEIDNPGSTSQDAHAAAVTDSSVNSSMENWKADVLMVDDDPKNLMALGALLEPLGQNLIGARSGEEALRLVLSHTFAVIVLDVRMPGMDGFALAKAVRGEQQFGDMPIIALSSSASPESIERGRQVGFHDYVAKFDRQSLIAALKEQTADVIQAA